MKDLEHALRSDTALSAQEEYLIRSALRLQRMGFRATVISGAQMSAVGELVRAATSHEEARRAVAEFISRQISKLKAKAARNGVTPDSWAFPVSGQEGESLGSVLVRWLLDETYLQMPIPAALDHLAALRNFWERFHGFFRYECEMGQRMPIREPTKRERAA